MKRYKVKLRRMVYFEAEIEVYASGPDTAKVNASAEADTLRSEVWNVVCIVTEPETLGEVEK